MSASSCSPGVGLLTSSKTEKNKGLLHDAAAPVFCNIILNILFVGIFVAQAMTV